LITTDTVDPVRVTEVASVHHVPSIIRQNSILFRRSLTIILPSSHHPLTILSPSSHHPLTILSPSSHHPLTTLSPSSHHPLTIISPTPKARLLPMANTCELPLLFWVCTVNGYRGCCLDNPCVNAEPICIGSSALAGVAAASSSNYEPFNPSLGVSINVPALPSSLLSLVSPMTTGINIAGSTISTTSLISASTSTVPTPVGASVQSVGLTHADAAGGAIGFIALGAVLAGLAFILWQCCQARRTRRVEKSASGNSDLADKFFIQTTYDMPPTQRYTILEGIAF
jgi:hypothetical protein